MDDKALRARLLVIDAVQKDLGLTPSQISAIADLVKTSRELFHASKAIFPPGRYSPEEMNKRWPKEQALLSDYEEKSKELVKKSLALLTPGQDERLKQIQLQSSIVAALARPEVAKALKISRGQRAEIQKLCDESDKKQRSQFPHVSGLDPKERRQKLIEFMKDQDNNCADVTKQILGVLNPEQRAKLEQLEGKRFDLTRPYDALIPEDEDFGF